MTLLFYCQHSLGLGHFVRSAVLADRLARDFHVVFMNGGPVPEGVMFPDAVERIDLPPIGMDENSRLVSLRPGLTPSEALDVRRDQMLDILRTRRPDVLLIELFPFGRRKFEPELVPLLDRARLLPDRPLIVSSLRDLLVTGRATQQRFDDRAQALCDRYFDLVLVHADPALASIEESFRPTIPMRTPVEYTGFMSRTAAPAPATIREGIVVSAGGGQVGAPLYRLAVEAHQRTWASRGLRTTIVAGPFAPPAVLAWLKEEAAATDGLTIVPHVPDLRVLLASAAASVSQCGYNTALDLMATGVPAFVLPYGDERENEQRRRAERLAARGSLRCAAGVLTAEALAGAVVDLLDFTPSPAGLMLDGADATTRLIMARLAAASVLADCQECRS